MSVNAHAVIKHNFISKLRQTQRVCSSWDWQCSLHKTKWLSHVKFLVHKCGKEQGGGGGGVRGWAPLKMMSIKSLVNDNNNYNHNDYGDNDDCDDDDNND